MLLFTSFPEVLWAVVNNAGLSTFGEVEWVQEHTFKKMLEVNVMGIVTVTKAFLPLIRRAKGEDAARRTLMLNTAPGIHADTPKLFKAGRCWPSGRDGSLSPATIPFPLTFAE